VSDDFSTPGVAERLERAARAAHTLSEALWEALHEELADRRAEVEPGDRRVAELSERLADVSATVGLLARWAARPSSPEPPPPARRGAFARPAPPKPSVAPVESEPRIAPVEPDPRVARVEPAHVEPDPRVARVEPAHVEPESPRAAYEEPRSSSSTPLGEARAAQEPLVAAVLVDELAPEGSPEIQIRDERVKESGRERGVHGEDDRDAWVGAIGRGLERYERDGEGFAVLLVELADVERLRHAELPGEMSRLTGLVEGALAGELGPADSLTRESPGRYWLLASETDARGARLLAERLAAAVRTAPSHRGAPLEVAAGIAVCPADGVQAAALAAHADIGLYAARASGRPIAP
jgi:GGDEF domain-containing protein